MNALCSRAFGPMPKLVPLLARHFTVYLYDRRGPNATLPYDATVMGDFTVPTESVSSVTAPTLVMDGGKSPARLRFVVANVTNAAPGAQRVTLKGQTHNVAMNVLAPVVEEFFTCN